MRAASAVSLSFRRGAIVGALLSLIPVLYLAKLWWVPPVSGDDIMAAGYVSLLAAAPASLLLPGDFTSRGLLFEIVALGLVTVQWAAVGALLGGLLGWVGRQHASAARAI